MKYFLFVPLLLGLIAYIGTETHPGQVLSHRSAATANEVIACAPPQRELSADEQGKFMNPIPGLGAYTYKISTGGDSAQFYFNQGLNFYYGYHLRESLASFAEAARFDSTAAMAYWGEALAMGPYFNVYTYKMNKGVPDALAKMDTHRGGASGKENALIDAMKKRYSADTTNADRPQLDSAYAGSLRPLIAKYPADPDIKALYIDAVMLEHKWDFWTPQRTPKPWTPELIALCEEILKQNPHHPAALHYYIHLTEASADASRALPGADRLRADMPGLGHMVHMATHMYQRNGLFAKGVSVNEEANDAVNLEDSLAPMLHVGKNDILHIYAVQSYCAMNGGMYLSGMRVYDRARERVLASKAVFEKDLYAQFIYMLPTLACVRLGKWNEVIAAPTPAKTWKYATVLNCFAKGMAKVRGNDLATARAYLDTLKGNLSDSLMNVRSRPFDKPVRCAQIAAGLLDAEIRFADGDRETALTALRKTVESEDSLIYREPQQWVLPVRQYLGAALLQVHQVRAAEAVYREDLSRNPGNGWSLLGLYQSLVLEKNPAEAAQTKIKYRAAFAAGDVQPTASVF